MQHEAELVIRLFTHDGSNCWVVLEGNALGDEAVREAVGEAEFTPASFGDLEALSQDYGQLLEKHLHATEAVRDAFRDALQAARGVPLRVRLSINGPGAGGLHGLRWESLWSSVLDDFLTTHRNIFFSRLLAVNAPRLVRPRVRSPLRALVAVVGHSGDGWEIVVRTAPWREVRRRLSPITVDEEVRKARKWLEPTAVTVLPRPGTLTNLLEKIAELGPDILYLCCHGGYEEGKPHLYLEAGDDSADGVHRADELVRGLSRLEVLPMLVVLASCHSAGGATIDEGALATLGPRLAAIGISAVLAMQGNVLQATVAQFMPTFFRELLADGRVDRAAAVARGRIQRSRIDFWAPTLFYQLRGGSLWVHEEPGHPGTSPGTPVNLSKSQRDALVDALGRFHCLKAPYFRRQVVDALPWYGLGGTAARPDLAARLADAWFQFGDRAGVLAEVLEVFEPEAAEDPAPALAGLYDQLDVLCHLRLTWRRLAALKRILTEGAVLPDRVALEFLSAHPDVRLPPELPGRPAAFSWVEGLARLTDSERQPLFDFLQLFRARCLSADMADRVGAWMDEAARACGWPLPPPVPAVAEPEEAVLQVVCERLRRGQYATRAWLDEGGKPRRLTAPDGEVSEARLPAVVAALLDECARLRKSAAPLRVELVLPLELLNRNVDQWPVAAGGGLRPLGTLHRTVVRSAERLYGAPGPDRAALADAWGRRHGRLRPDAGVAEGDLTWVCGPQSAADLGAAAGTVCAVTAVVPPRDGRQTLDAVIRAGFSLAVWSRVQGAPEGAWRDHLRKLLVGATPGSIAERVRGLRREAEHSGGPDHPGRHMSLLWDDPGRQPPDCVYLYDQPA